MLNLARLFTRMWPTFWSFISQATGRVCQFLTRLGRAEARPPNEEVEHHGETGEQPSNVGRFSIMLPEFLVLTFLRSRLSQQSPVILLSKNTK